MQKNFKEIIIKSRLEIGIDPDYGLHVYYDLHRKKIGFIEKNRKTGEIENMKKYKKIILETKDYASNAYEHLNLIKKELQKDNDNTQVFTVYKYEHSNATYALNLDTLPKCRFATGVAGFLFAETEEEAKEFMEEYNRIDDTYYYCKLYDNEGVYIDGCNGLTSLESILDFLAENGEKNTWTKEEIEAMIANAI